MMMDAEDEIEGFRVVVESLKNLGVKYIFGVVGIPVVEVREDVKQFNGPLAEKCEQTPSTAIRKENLMGKNQLLTIVIVDNFR